MRRDFDKKIDELNKLKLNVIGEQFVLDSQINIMLQQNHKIEDVGKEHERDSNKTKFDLEKLLKDVSKQRLDYETELKTMEHELNRENEGHYENVMVIQKEKAFEEVTDQRFKQETLLDEELIKVKDDQIAQMKAEREQVQVKL